MTDTKDELNQQQLLVINMIAGGSTQAAAARKVGIDKRTVHNWMKKEAFRAELDSQCKLVLDSIVPEALNLLRSQMNNVKLDPYVRQNAARDLLNRAGVGPEKLAQATQIIIETASAMPELGQAQELIVDAGVEIQ